MTRHDLYQEDIERRYDELRMEGKKDAEALKLSKEQIQHPHADPEVL